MPQLWPLGAPTPCITPTLGQLWPLWPLEEPCPSPCDPNLKVYVYNDPLDGNARVRAIGSITGPYSYIDSFSSPGYLWLQDPSGDNGTIVLLSIGDGSATSWQRFEIQSVDFIASTFSSQEFLGGTRLNGVEMLFYYAPLLDDPSLFGLYLPAAYTGECIDSEQGFPIPNTLVGSGLVASFTLTTSETVEVYLRDPDNPCDQPPYYCNTNVNPSCVTDLSYAWDGCTDITTFPIIDVSSGTDFGSAWRGCNNMTSFPALNTGSGIYFQYSWQSCYNLTSFPLINVGSGEYFSGAWAYCYGLTSFPTLDTSSGVYFNSAWLNCSGLTSFPPLDFSSGVNFYYAWRNCTSLTSFPAGMFDTCTATLSTAFSFAWNNCALNQTSVDNILVSLDTSGMVNKIVHLNGGTSSTPGSTGLAAKASLISKGWTVFTN